LSQVLIDTNVLIDLVFEHSELLSRRFSAATYAGDALFLSAISLYEFRFGAERSRRRDFQLTALAGFLSTVAVIDFDSADAERAALLKGALAARCAMIGSLDLLIAAQALERGLTMVTGNRREFARIDGLALEDWRAPA
jgi:tRNA(fMet)-specific endonuclease VapC